MANDFRGDPEEFAVVVPVPTVLQRDQIHVGDKRLIEHLDAYTAPRLVEYFDPDPCARVYARRAVGASTEVRRERDDARNRALGVGVEATYTVGEYDIVILSATQSDGLESWLRENNYQIPPGAREVLGSYIRQGMRFFVARVNLNEREALGYGYLRPLQIAYESPKFMLPIRLGMVNADGPQDLFVFALTRQGRVETTNYRTVRLPSDVEIPVFVKEAQQFGDFYQAMFSRAVEQENRRGVFLEYAWDMAWCDPCAADPLSPEQLGSLGVFWVGGQTNGTTAAPDVFVTRLHVRYDAEHFPDDLVFQQTGDRSNFQGRYVLRHPWTGESSCSAVSNYRRRLAARHEQQGPDAGLAYRVDLREIRRKMGTTRLYPPIDERPWWQRLWKR